MIYLTGDTHGDLTRVVDFCVKYRLTAQDVVVILGDVGLNYYLNDRERMVKAELISLPPTFLCIHGNHEMRPEHISSYKTDSWHGGSAWREDDYPNILFAKDGEIYDLDGKKCVAIGGAYSVDKYYRLAKGAQWWEDEQPSEDTKRKIEMALKAQRIDCVLAHTCPYRYIPREAFLPMIDLDSVDSSTERWLDTIEESFDYTAWFCGHWHIDKRIDSIHFLFQTFETLGGIQ